MSELTVSVLIPFRSWDGVVSRCVESCLNQTVAPREVILLPDHSLEVYPAGCMQFVTGGVFPGKKRNLGCRGASGRIYGFIDADAEADRRWIEMALTLFSDASIGAVGGPNLLPDDATEREIAGWEIVSSPLMAGPLSCRYRLCEAHDRLELQSSNLFIRDELFHRCGGFREDILTGEDTELCFRLVKQRFRVHYHPEVRVHHRPRPLFLPHLRQMFGYGRDQSKVLGVLRLGKQMLWLLPFVSLGIFIISVSTCLLGHPWPLLILSACYSAWMIVAAASGGPPRRMILRFVGGVGTHVFYGIGMWYGFITAIVPSLHAERVSSGPRSR